LIDFRAQLIALLLVFCLAGMHDGNAATITVTNFSNTCRDKTISGDGTGSATLAVTDQVTNNSTSPQTIEITISNLDINGSSSADDKVILSFIVSTDGQNIQTVTGSNQTGWFSSGGGTLNASGEYIRVAFSQLEIQLDGGTDSGNYTGTFNGFTHAEFGSWGTGDIGTMNGTEITAGANPNTTREVDLSGSPTYVKVEYTGTSAGDFRLKDMNFTFDVVPEPSAFTLFAGTSFLLRIGRRQRRI
jgi:hypothetical protein